MIYAMAYCKKCCGSSNYDAGTTIDNVTNCKQCGTKEFIIVKDVTMTCPHNYVELESWGRLSKCRCTMCGTVTSFSSDD